MTRFNSLRYDDKIRDKDNEKIEAKKRESD